MFEKIKTTESKPEQIVKVAAGLQKTVSNVIRNTPRELIEETIYIDSERDGQLVIPRYRDPIGPSETVLH